MKRLLLIALTLAALLVGAHPRDVVAQTTIPACTQYAPTSPGWTLGCSNPTLRLSNVLANTYTGYTGLVCSGTSEHHGVLTINGEPATGDGTQMLVYLHMMVHVTGFKLHYALVYDAVKDEALDGDYTPLQFIDGFGYEVVDEATNWPAPMGKPLAYPLAADHYLYVIYKCESTQPNLTDQVWFFPGHVKMQSEAVNSTRCPNVVVETNGTVDYGTYSNTYTVNSSGEYQYDSYGSDVTYSTISVPAGWTPHCAVYNRAIVNGTTNVISDWWNPAPYEQIIAGSGIIASTFTYGQKTPEEYLYGMVGGMNDINATFGTGGLRGRLNVAGNGVQRMIEAPGHLNNHYYVTAYGTDSSNNPITGDHVGMILFYYVFEDQVPFF